MDALLDSAPCGFLTVDDHELIVEANATLSRWLGYAPCSLDGASLGEVLSPASGVYFETHIGPLLLLQDAVGEVYLTVQTVSGDDLPVLMSAARRQRETDTGTDAVTDIVLLRVSDRS